LEKKVGRRGLFAVRKRAWRFPVIRKMKEGLKSLSCPLKGR